MLVAALCIPVFLVVQFDTGILYQVGVFAYGCINGLFVLGLGQVVTWNDLVKQFENGMLLLVPHTWLQVLLSGAWHGPVLVGFCLGAPKSCITK